MTGISVPTSADIRLEMDGKRIAVVQSYRVQSRADCAVIGAFGCNEPIAVVRGPASYTITLSRVYATDEAISDGIRFHDLHNFSLVITKPERSIVFSGCEWTALSEHAEVGSSILEEATICAATRGEYEE